MNYCCYPTVWWLLCVVSMSLLLPCMAAGEAAAPKLYYSQWGSPICDDTVTDRTQPVITVSGVVFADLNGDGQMNGEEKGIPDVRVSDGVQVVRTDVGGAYTLPNVQPGVQRTVFVIVPTGYRIGGQFFHVIPVPCDGMTADFGLVADPQSVKANHAFVHVTDSHITGKGATCFAEMKALPIAFIVATGDLTNNRELEAYQDAAAKAPAPLLNLPGNHDVLVNGSGALGGPFGTDASYEDLLGPKYYAFNYGGRHYVLLNTVEDMPRQLAWLKNDLALQPAETELIILQHYPPTNAQMALYQQLNTRAVFCGHTHANRVFKMGKVLFVDTPPLLRIGLDLSPRTFRVVTFTDGKLELRSYSTGYGNQAAYIAPDLPASGAQPPTVQLRHDWPMFNGDPARTGVAHDAVKPPFAVAWQQPLGLTIHIASPVVGNGMVYIGAGDDARAERSGVYALDAATGTVRWHYPTAAKVAHSVSLADGMVVATSNDGIVHAIDAATGAGRWTYRLGSPLDCWLYTSPLIVDKQVVCGTGQYFTALELATGKPVWRMPPASAGHWPTYGSPAALDGKVFGAFPGVGAFMCAALTGTRRWQADKSIAIGSTNAATVAAGGNTAYVRTGSALYALDVDTGAERWQYKNKGGASSPVVTATEIILGMGNGAVTKLDDAGKEIWTYAGTTLRVKGKAKLYFEPLQIATPIVSGGIVYTCTTDGHLLALDEATGAELAVQEFGVPFTASPAISGNTLFLASYNGIVYALVSTVP